MTDRDRIRTGEQVAAERIVLPAGVTPRLLSREAAAAYCGMSENSFDQEVAAGTFPGPVDLKRVKRLLWDRKALDLALDSKIVSVDLGPDDLRFARERYERRRQQRREGNAQNAG